MAQPNNATQAQGQATRVSSAGGKVTVASKLPFPLRIRPFKMVTVVEQMRDGTTRELQVAEPLPENYIVHGIAIKRNTQHPVPIRFGYAMTEGIPADAFEQWAKDNKDQPFMKNKLVFAMPDMREAEAVAKENEGRVTNLEPLNPEGDARVAPPAVGMTKIETATAA